MKRGREVLADLGCQNLLMCEEERSGNSDTHSREDPTVKERLRVVEKGKETHKTCR